MSGLATTSADALLADRQGAVLHVTLNRPDKSNALSASLVEALIALLDRAAGDGISLLVFRGEGRNFCSGFDLGDLSAQSDGDLLLKLVRIETMLQKVAHAPFTTLALAQGKVIGAGCDLFCACALRIATPDAAFRMPGWRFGIALGTRRLVRRVGPDAARSVLSDSRLFPAAEALSMGLVTRLAQREDWPALLAAEAGRAEILDPWSQAQLLALTENDTRDADLAALVTSASRPGLRARIERYRIAEQQARAAR